MSELIDERPARGIPLRALAPNAITALALCFGLTGVRFAIGGEWDKALGSIIVAGILDGLDGRVARLLARQQQVRRRARQPERQYRVRHRAGADPVPVVAAGGAASSAGSRRLALAVCCALRLARFNARIDAGPQPHKEAGFNTGVPAPAGAGLAFVPIYLWLITGNELFRELVCW